MNDNTKQVILELAKSKLEEQRPVEEIDTTKKIEISKREPKSKTECLTHSLYFKLKDEVDSPDYFDKMVENNKEISLIVWKKALAYFIKEVPEKVEDIQATLFKIAELKCENNLDLEYIRNRINEGFKNNSDDRELVIDLANLTSSDEIEHNFDSFVKKQLEEVEKNLEQGVSNELIKQAEQQITKIKQNNIEELSADLNSIVDMGKDTWQLFILSTMSPYASDLIINGVKQRKNIHSLMVGDISAGKSTISRIIRKISPKADMFTKLSEATMEGIADREGIQEGELERLNDGLLVVPEFDKFKSNTILKEILDCGIMKFGKGGHTKEIDLNMTCLCSANPKSEFFQKNILIREQIDHPESVMSRFDVIIPISNTIVKIDSILDKLTLFGGIKENFDLDQIGVSLSTIATLMRKVEKVTITAEQQKKLIDMFKFHNRELENRPFLIIRDLEGYCRILNTMAILNYIMTNPEGLKPNIEVTDYDMESATKLWEYLVRLKDQIYCSKSRTIRDITDEILARLSIAGELKTKEMSDEFVKDKICSQATFYRKIKDLILEKRIVQKNGLKDTTIVLRTGLSEGETNGV